jgi:hypothetical protein
MSADWPLRKGPFPPDWVVFWTKAQFHGGSRLVGARRLELQTSSLSGTRSNQLSYAPGVVSALFHLISVMCCDRV